MKTYMESYRERLARNQEDLINLINEVQQKDNSIEAYVYDYADRFLQGVVFIKGEEINSIHFHEVPYRWSGCGYGEFNKSHSGLENSKMPFSADDIIQNFKPINGVRKSQVQTFKSKEDYLKWYSYLNIYKK